jgi:hypothetical protein
MVLIEEVPDGGYGRADECDPCGVSGEGLRWRPLSTT